MAMKESTRKLLDYLKAHDGEDLTAEDIAKALGIEDKRVVDGGFTSFQRKKWGVRVPAEIELEDGTHQTVKYLKLTDEGFNADPDEPTETVAN